MRNHRKLKCLVQIAISAVIAAVIIYHLDIKGFIGLFSRISVPVIVIILCLLLVSLAIRGYRWKLLFDNHINRIKLRESMTLLLVGLALNLVLPASTGDIVKSYFGYKWSGVKERMLSISLLDKVIALASIAALGIPFAIYLRNWLYGGLAVLVLAPATILLLLPWLTDKVSWCRNFFQAATRIGRGKLNFLTVIRETRISRDKLVWAWAISVLGWALTYGQMYLCFQAIDVSVPLFYVFAVSPLITLVRLFPFTLGGIGSDEAALCYFFLQAGATLEEILAAALIYRVLTIILPGLIGLFLLAGTKRIETGNTQTE
jgi:uncharacterized protein (TIRG00374 family)